MTAIGGTTLRPLGIGEVLDAALKVYRNNFKTLVIAVLAVILPLTILSTLITASTVEDAFDYSATATVDDGGTAIAGQLVSSLVSVLGYLVATAACFYAVMRAYIGEGATWQESVKFGLKRVFPLLVMGFLVVLALIPAFLLLIVPGVFLLVRWSVAAPALLAEEIGPVAALGRSFRLVADRWWATFGALLAMYILTLVLQFIVGLLIGLIFADLSNELLVATVLTIVTALGYAVTLPITAAVATIIYYDLRVRKEGYDLQLAAQGMGSGPSAIPGDDTPSGGGFAPPSGESGFSAPSAFGPPQPAEQPATTPMDTTGSVPPPGAGGSSGLAIPTPAPPAPPVAAPEPAAPEPDPAPSGFGEPAAPEPDPAPSGFGEPVAPAAPEPTPEPTGGGFSAPEEPAPSSTPESEEEPGFSWSPTPPAAEEDDTAPPPPGGSPPASQ